jgi:hypothetical protein
VADEASARCPPTGSLWTPLSRALPPIRQTPTPPSGPALDPLMGLLECGAEGAVPAVVADVALDVDMAAGE